jgi:excisionase family DNA binding protein
MNDNVKPNDFIEKKGNEYETNDLIKILTVQEVADLLRIHRSTVTRLAKSGEIKSYKLGNRRLFKDVDVLAFFENQVDLQCVSVKEI